LFVTGGNTPISSDHSSVGRSSYMPFSKAIIHAYSRLLECQAWMGAKLRMPASSTLILVPQKYQTLFERYVGLRFLDWAHSMTIRVIRSLIMSQMIPAVPWCCICSIFSLLIAMICFCFGGGHLRRVERWHVCCSRRSTEDRLLPVDMCRNQ
jgi:hypothetical protein